MIDLKIEHYITGEIGANTFFVYDDTGKGFVVDPGGRAPRMIESIKEKNIDLEYIILTHGHCDHIGGIPDVKAAFPNAKILAYVDEKEMLESPAQNASLMFLGQEMIVHADVFVKDYETLKIGDMELKFIHTPGHSKGGMCILVDDVCFSGDTLFRASVGRSDLYGGDWNTLAKSIKERLFTLPDDTIVLPGHMGETTIGFEKTHNPFVRG